MLPPWVNRTFLFCFKMSMAFSINICNLVRKRSLSITYPIFGPIKGVFGTNLGHTKFTRKVYDYIYMYSLQTSFVAAELFKCAACICKIVHIHDNAFKPEISSDSQQVQGPTGNKIYKCKMLLCCYFKSSF